MLKYVKCFLFISVKPFKAAEPVGLAAAARVGRRCGCQGRGLDASRDRRGPLSLNHFEDVRRMDLKR